jgi:hypothetical protein
MLDHMANDKPVDQRATQHGQQITATQPRRDELECRRNSASSCCCHKGRERSSLRARKSFHSVKRADSYAIG